MVKLPSTSTEAPFPDLTFRMEAPLTGAPLESTTFPCTTSPTSCANNDEDEHKLTAIISILETIAFRKASMVGLWINFRIWSLVFFDGKAKEISKRDAPGKANVCPGGQSAFRRLSARSRYGCIR